METIGIIAGFGELPSLCAQGAAASGHTVALFDLVPSQLFLLPQAQQEEILLERKALKAEVDFYSEVGLGDFSRIIGLAHKLQIQQMVSVGKVRKDALFHNQKLDQRLMELLASLPLHNDDAIQKAVVGELEREGILVLSQLHFLRSSVPGPGVLTEHVPTPELWQDLDYGYKLAKAVAGLDIGQTVVVKQRAVLAVEALEGTDRTIRRGAELGGEGTVVVKVSKPQQDPRFDIPVIGPDTLKTVIDVRAKVLAFDANLTLLMHKEELIAQAQNAGICLVAMEGVK